MDGYRAYTLDAQGHVLSRLEFEAADDAAARTDARQQRSGLSGARAMVAAFPSPLGHLARADASPLRSGEHQGSVRLTDSRLLQQDYRPRAERLVYA